VVGHTAEAALGTTCCMVLLVPVEPWSLVIWPKVKYGCWYFTKRGRPNTMRVLHYRQVLVVQAGRGQWRAADRGAQLTNQILAEHQLAAEGDLKVGSGRYCPPRHRMPFDAV
jgi:hypothetical protein